MVLNAFRHQRFNTLYFIKIRNTVTLCSTPFGIRDSTRQNLIDSVDGDIVLNAFRHQRFNTLEAITASLEAYCAQRLSASEIQHPAAIGNHNESNLVLNAFRHQRFNTIKSRLFGVANYRAQRLSASEIQHCGVERHGLVFMSAQRLSASEIQHPWLLSTFARFLPVLNAFRHQRFNTVSGYCGTFNGVQCSTPFGIRDSTQSLWYPQSWDCLGAQRLSASEIQHIPRPREAGWGSCAQRLSASEIQHLKMIATPNTITNVLNAFRHQRFNTATAKTLVGFVTEANLASTS